MAYRTPVIINNTLSIEEGIFPSVTLGSDSWFAWLETAQSFAYIRDGMRLTVRKQRQQKYTYWYGYLKHTGRVHCVYIGKTSHMTAARLQQAVEDLQQRLGLAAPDTVSSRHSSHSDRPIELDHLYAQLSYLQSLLRTRRRTSRHVIQAVLEYTELVLRSIREEQMHRLQFQQAVRQRHAFLPPQAD